MGPGLFSEVVLWPVGRVVHVSAIPLISLTPLLRHIHTLLLFFVSYGRPLSVLMRTAAPGPLTQCALRPHFLSLGIVLGFPTPQGGLKSRRLIPSTLLFVCRPLYPSWVLEGF